MGSSRLPGKVLRPLGSGTVLSWVVRAAREAGVADLVVATTEDPSDEPVVVEGAALGCRVARGPVEDVLSRFLLALEGVPDETVVVRLTADCPLLDPGVIALAVRAFTGSGLDYLSTTQPRSLPRGLDVEVTSAGALRSIGPVAVGPERIHVTPRFYRHPEEHRTAGLVFAPDASDLRVTLDTAEDAELIERLVAVLGDEPPAWRDLVAALRARPELVALNADVHQKALDEG